MLLPPNDYRKEKLREALRLSLTDYIEANSSISSDSSLLHIYRALQELAIARMALTEAANSFLKLKEAAESTCQLAHDEYKDILEKSKRPLLAGETPISPETLELRAKTFVKIIDEKLESICNRCYNLIAASSAVAKTAKTAAEIETLLSSRLDAVQIYSIISSLPDIFSTFLSTTLSSFFEERSLTISNGKPLPLIPTLEELKSLLLNAFNDELSKSTSVLVSNPQFGSPRLESSSPSITQEQILSMLKSVPTEAPNSSTY